MDRSGIDFLMAMPQYGLGSDVALRPGLDRIRKLLERMDHPERHFPVIHVAGTNGKGSTASFVAAILTAHGLRCGLHTSPHLVQPGERMRVDGVEATPGSLNRAILEYRDAIEAVGASYFETTVALSLLSFARNGVDVAVVEVGLGGRLDATNVLDPAVSVVTRIGLDHTHILGNSLAEIAEEKAGIIKADRPVVVAMQDPTASAVLRKRAGKVGAPYLDVGASTRWKGRTLQTGEAKYTRLFPALRGQHHLSNAATAVVACETFLDHPLDLQAVRAGLRQVSRLAGLRARYETWSEAPLVVLDVGHNPDAVVPTLRMFADEPAKSRVVFLGLMKDKDVAPIAAELARLGLLVRACGIESPRAMDVDELTEALAAAGARTGDAVSAGQLRPVVVSLEADAAALIVGSHQLVGGLLEASATDAL